MYEKLRIKLPIFCCSLWISTGSRSNHEYHELFCTHTTCSRATSLGLSINFLLAESLRFLVEILIRGWGLLLISIQWLVSSLARDASVLHPQEHNHLANEHSNSRSSHTKSNTDQDGYKDNFEGSPEDHGHTVNEALVVVVVVDMALRFKGNVGGELHSTIWEAVRHSMVARTLVMVRVGLVLVPSELVEAFHTETLHLVTGSLGRRLRFGHANDHFGKDAAQDSLTLGVWGVWRDGDGLGGVKYELNSVSSMICKRDVWKWAYCSVVFFDSCDLDIVDLDHLAIKTHDSYKDGDK